MTLFTATVLSLENWGNAGRLLGVASDSRQMSRVDSCGPTLAFPYPDFVVANSKPIWLLGGVSEP